MIRIWLLESSECQRSSDYFSKCVSFDFALLTSSWKILWLPDTTSCFKKNSGSVHFFLRRWYDQDQTFQRWRRSAAARSYRGHDSLWIVSENLVALSTLTSRDTSWVYVFEIREQTCNVFTLQILIGRANFHPDDRKAKEISFRINVVQVVWSRLMNFGCKSGF